MAKKKKKSKMSRKQQLEHQKNMELPINKFLNAQDKDGNILYPIATKMRNYIISNCGPVHDQLRMANALLHEIRFHEAQAEMYLDLFTDQEKEIRVRDQHGQLLSRDQCYVNSIAERQAKYLALTRLREQLGSKLLSMCDGTIFTFDQFNGYVTAIEEKLADMNLTLFPDRVQVMEPL